MTTHFSNDGQTTLCGLTVESIIMNDRPANCDQCKAIHYETTGWAFPLPVTVTTA